MTLAEALLALLIETVPPGGTKFSVAPAADCAAEQETPCEGAVWSTFYGTWVRQETAAQATERYKMIVRSTIAAGEKVICLDEQNQEIADCVPYEGTRSKQGKPVFSLVPLVTLAVAGATYESGFREDVQVGRGWAKKASDDGGMGRGPGLEGGLLQNHPTIAWKYVPDLPDDVRARAESGNAEAREAAVKLIVGSDEESVTRGFETAMRMMVAMRNYCAWAAPKEAWYVATFAAYGTGNSCTSLNNGKTMLRAGLYVKLFNKLKSLRAKKVEAPSLVSRIEQ